MKKIVVTGGTGYIGSHVSLLLLQMGYKIIILDSFMNSYPSVLEKITEITSAKNKNLLDNVQLIKCDLQDERNLFDIFREHNSSSNKIEAVIHLAGLKSVNESIKLPLKYWSTNVSGTINLLNIMNSFSCKNIVFSSSATIYGNIKENQLIKENFDIKPINTYGKTKQVIENILESLFINKQNDWCISILRYFNPIGAHSSGLIGENPLLPPNNIMPLLNEVALGRKDFLQIYGNNWDTPDGTCIRDYIHVMDLAMGHIKALEYTLGEESSFQTFNLGTGKGVSVLDLVKTFERVNNIKIPFKFISRRIGDVPFSVADNSKAKKMINWIPNYDLESMCRDSWNFYSKVV